MLHRTFVLTVIGTLGLLAPPPEANARERVDYTSLETAWNMAAWKEVPVAGHLNFTRAWERTVLSSGLYHETIGNMTEWESSLVPDYSDITATWGRIEQLPSRLCQVRRYSDVHYTSYLFEGDFGVEGYKRFNLKKLTIMWELPNLKLVGPTLSERPTLIPSNGWEDVFRYDEICGFPEELKELR